MPKTIMSYSNEETARALTCFDLQEYRAHAVIRDIGAIERNLFDYCTQKLELSEEDAREIVETTKHVLQEDDE